MSHPGRKLSRDKKRLDDPTIKNATPDLKADGSYTPIWLHDGAGLYIKITANTSGDVSRYWFYRYSVNGKNRTLGLGPYPQIKLSDARTLAEQARRQRKEQRLDPIAERRRQDQAREVAEHKAAEETAVAKARTVTFAEAAEQYHAAHKPEWRSTKHATKWQKLIENHVNPVLGKIPVADVDQDLVHRFHKTGHLHGIHSDSIALYPGL